MAHFKNSGPVMLYNIIYYIIQKNFRTIRRLDLMRFGLMSFRTIRNRTEGQTDTEPARRPGGGSETATESGGWPKLPSDPLKPFLFSKSKNAVHKTRFSDFRNFQNKKMKKPVHKIAFSDFQNFFKKR